MNHKMIKKNLFIYLYKFLYIISELIKFDLRDILNYLYLIYNPIQWCYLMHQTQLLLQTKNVILLRIYTNYMYLYTNRF